MGFPKQIKKNIELTPYRTLYPRRVELLDKINEHGTFLPKSILHADLDKGFLDFVKNDLQVVSDGKVIPTTDILITTQNWSQFTQTWNFQDLDKNVAPPFITVVRAPEIKYGSLPSLQYTIPNRRQFYYASVPSFDGDRVNVDVYKIPQPIPVDIKFSLKIICNRMRELNALNKTILQKFSSRQAYAQIKGHYIPIIWDNVSDESVMDVEKRKYYIQTYDFTMMGFLLDEDEFEVKPGVERVFQIYEVTGNETRRQKRTKENNPSSYEVDIEFTDENVLVLKRFYDTVDLSWMSSSNVSNYDVYINGDYYGSNLSKIQVNGGNLVKFEITKEMSNQTSTLKFISTLL
jgi:hypothetical protein